MKEFIKNQLFLLFVGLFFLSLMIFLVGNNKLFLLVNQEIANPVLDFIVLKIFIPLFFLLGIVPFLMLFSQKDRALGAFSLISGPFCYITGNLIKLFFEMPRPFVVLEGMARIIGPWHVGQFSFPSTTTMLAFGFTLPFLLERKSKWSYLSLLLSFLVGFTVIYTGFHFPRDVLFGTLLSFLLVFFLSKIKNKIWKNASM